MTTPILAQSFSQMTFPKRSIRTYTGHYIDVFAPKSDSIAIEDIAHALSQLCRYGGHCDPFYSVGQHSIICSYMVAEEFALEALLHDATEAYLVDIPRPIKKEFEFYTQVEDHLYKFVAEKFNLQFPIPDEVHVVDNSILEYEWFYFMEGMPKPEHKEFYDKHFKPMSCKSVENEFLERFTILMNNRELKNN